MLLVCRRPGKLALLFALPALWWHLQIPNRRCDPCQSGETSIHCQLTLQLSAIIAYSYRLYVYVQSPPGTRRWLVGKPFAGSTKLRSRIAISNSSFSPLAQKAAVAVTPQLAWTPSHGHGWSIGEWRLDIAYPHEESTNPDVLCARNYSQSRPGSFTPKPACFWAQIPQEIRETEPL